MNARPAIALAAIGSLLLVCAIGCGDKPEEKVVPQGPDDPTKPARFSATLRARAEVPESSPESVALSPDGKLAVIGGGKALQFWSIPDAKLVRKIQVVDPDAKYGATQQVLFFPDGKKVAAVVATQGKAGYDVRVGIWDVETGKEVPHPVPASPSFAIALSADGTRLAVAGRGEQKAGGGRVQVWDLKRARRLHDFQPDPFEAGRGEAVAFSPDGKHLAVGFSVPEPFKKEVKTPQPLLWAWDLETGKRVFKEWEARGVTRVTFSPDGSRLAAVGGDLKWHGIRLWDFPAKKLLHSLRSDEKFVTSLAFHPRGRVLASGGNDATIRLWDVLTGKQVGKLEGHTAQVRELAFSRDGTVLLSVGLDTQLLVWEQEEETVSGTD